MIVIAIILGCIIGALIGINAPIIPYTYSTFLAIAVIAALDSVFGGIASVMKKNFDLKIFICGGQDYEQSVSHPAHRGPSPGAAQAVGDA